MRQKHIVQMPQCCIDGLHNLKTARDLWVLLTQLPEAHTTCGL